MGKPCPKHAAEFKRRAAQPCNERGTACAEVAREAGVDPSSLADWARRASAAAPDAGADPFQMAGGLRRPRRGNERLKREDDTATLKTAICATASSRSRHRSSADRTNVLQPVAPL